MFGLGVSELLLILVLAVFLFGSKKLPSLAKGMGEAIREFKKARAEQVQSDEELPKS